MITFQPEFRPALPFVYAAKDYRDFRAVLTEMDRILVVSGLEMRAISRLVETREQPCTSKQMMWMRRALRYNILLSLTRLSHRELSLRVADSLLFQWFTYTGSFDAVRAASKSSIERFEKQFPEEQIEELIHALNAAVADKQNAWQLLYREAALRFDEIYADTTCVKANIHFPVDWVLLRDATRTIVCSINVIRRHGLCHRIGKPDAFTREMNRLSMEMTHTRRKQNARKARKTVLRKMKRLMKTLAGHAVRYRDMLVERHSETDLTQAEAQVIVERLDNVIGKLSTAIHQAHERIIGERRVESKDKILSLYEQDVHVIVRGKAGAEVEFGNTLYLAEQRDGLIVDWQFFRDQASAESAIAKPSVERINKNYGNLSSYTADRAFDTRANRDHLADIEVLNAICPRSPKLLNERMQDEAFKEHQKRRGSTEGRIGIFKNVCLGTPMRSKGFKHRKQRILWCIFTHNLWKLARMSAERLRELEKQESRQAA